MLNALLGTKLGMTQYIHDDGIVSAVTALEVGPCVVTQVKNSEKDGYDKIQIGYKQVPEKKMSNPEKGHLKKNGLDLFKYLREFAVARDYEIEIENNDNYGRPDITENIDVPALLDELHLTAGGNKIEARDYQKEAVTQAITTGRTLLLSPTASGKSLIIYSLIRYHQIKSRKQLIIVPTTSLVEQMYGDFADYSTKNGWRVSENCHRIYGGKEKTNEYPVTISTWQSIYKYPKKWFEQFDVVYGDEAHLFKAKSLTTLMNKLVATPYRVGTTGTLDGTKTHRLVLEGVFGQVHKVTTTKKLMDTNQLATLKIVCCMINWKDAHRKEVKGMTYQEEIDWIVTHPDRNEIIKNLTIAQEGNTLVLFQYVEKHGVVLHEMISKAVKANRKVFFVYGGTDTEVREEIRAITEKENNAIIVASLGTFSTGINIKRLHNLIFASPSKSQIRVLQSIGRGLRVSGDGINTKVYDIADDLHYKSKKNYTLDHAAERIKIYSKEKFKYKIFEINI